MKRSTKLFLCSGLSLFLLGCILGLVALGLGVLGDLRHASSPLQAENIYAPDEFSGISLLLSSDDVIISPSYDENIHIYYPTLQQDTYQFYPEASALDDTTILVVTKNAQTGGFLSKLRISFTPQDGTITLALPQNYTGSLQATLVSGDISLQDVSLQALQLSTISGGISGSNCTLAYYAILNATSGDMELENLQVSDYLSAESVSGSINLEDCSLGSCSLSSTSGDVSLQAAVFGDISVQTTSGDIELSLSGAPAHRFEALSTQSGEVTQQGGSIDSSAVLTAQSTSGDIDVFEE